MLIRRCKEADEGYAFAGVQWGRECFCGNEAPPTETIVDQDECNWPCSGDQDLVCGALWRMNVYETGASFPENSFSINLKLAASPPLTWEKGVTSVDIEDDSSAFLCEVTFSFAFDQGVVLKDATINGCKGK